MAQIETRFWIEDGRLMIESSAPTPEEFFKLCQAILQGARERNFPEGSWQRFAQNWIQDAIDYADKHPDSLKGDDWFDILMAKVAEYPGSPETIRPGVP